jgi:cytochrome c biogenesis protein CcmG, thiol:disulfide interchange protein DsbE
MKSRPAPQILAMLLVGVGLLLLSAVSLLLLSQSSPAAGEDASGGQGSETSAVPQIVDFQAPELHLKDLNGSSISLADYSGQFVLINNWATWCPPCRAEMPVLQGYYDAHHQQNFTIIAIESGEGADEVASFVTEYALTFPVWIDPAGIALDMFQNFSLPSSYLVDPGGRVRLAWSGAISMKMLEKYVTPLLEN